MCTVEPPNKGHVGTSSFSFKKRCPLFRVSLSEVPLYIILIFCICYGSMVAHAWYKTCIIILCCMMCVLSVCTYNVWTSHSTLQPLSGTF